MLNKDTTSEKILNAAESLFAAHGIGTVSLRKIVAQAQVNIASVNYHFGSKDELIKEVFRRRLREVNSERMRLLEKLRLEYNNGPIELREVLRALLVPALTLGQNKNQGRNFFRLASRAHSETNPVVQEVLYQELHSVIEEFLEEIKKSTLHLSEKERAARMAFVAGGMFKAALIPMQEMFIHRFFGGDLKIEQITEMLIDFCEGGLNAKSSL